MHTLTARLLICALFTTACGDDEAQLPPQHPAGSVDAGNFGGTERLLDAGMQQGGSPGRRPDGIAFGRDGGRLRRDGGRYDYQYDPPDFEYDPPDFDYNPKDFEDYADFGGADGRTINGYQITRHADGRVLIVTPQGQRCERNVGTGGGLSFNQEGPVVTIRINNILVVDKSSCVPSP